MDSIDLYDDFNEEQDARAGENDEEDAGEDGAAGEATVNEVGEEVDAKVKAVRVKRKLQTLNAERLKGPRGIIAVEDFFEDIKFKGKGYESQDLENVMKRMEHWAHRMFPKFNFDDSLAAIERLGRKKEINVHMVRYRMDQLTKDDGRVASDDEEAVEQNKEQFDEDVPMDEFEALIDEQIALTTVHSRSTADNHDKSFDNLLSSSSQFNHNVSSSTQISQPSKPTKHNKAPDSHPRATYKAQEHSEPQTSQSQEQQISSQPTMTDEVKLRIAENKRRALEILEQRKKKAEEEEKQKAQEAEWKHKISNILIDDD